MIYLYSVNAQVDLTKLVSTLLARADIAGALIVLLIFRLLSSLKKKRNILAWTGQCGGFK